jgi:predicted DNA-binding transcriptional regulator AlpA
MAQLITASEQRRICGNISEMTTWRWLNRPELNFPKPVKIGKRNYWDASELEAWINSRKQERVAS